jgi:hypothetical protein
VNTVRGIIGHHSLEDPRGVKLDGDSYTEKNQSILINPRNMTITDQSNSKSSYKGYESVINKVNPKVISTLKEPNIKPNLTELKIGF